MGEGDNHYCVRVDPPLFDDSVWGRVSVQTRGTQHSSTKVNSQEEAHKAIQRGLNQIRDRVRTPDINTSGCFPELPTPQNTSTVIHSDYEDVISVGEIWDGEANTSPSKFDDEPWYQHQTVYCGTISKIHEDPDKVLRIESWDRGKPTTIWVGYQALGHSLVLVSHSSRREGVDIRSATWTTVTRIAGGIGIGYDKPNVLEVYNREDTPFENGYSEEEVEKTIETALSTLPESEVQVTSMTD